MKFLSIKKIMSALKPFQNTSLEAEVLKYVGQPYIIYSLKGTFLRGHPKVSEVLWNLGMGEKDIKTRSALIAGLKSQEMTAYDDAARQILQEQILLEDATNFAGIAEFEGSYILVQVKDTPKGSYALFKDVSNEYILLSSGTRLSFDTSTMLGVLQNLPCGVVICDARDENFSTLCVNHSFLKIISARGQDIQEKPLFEVLSRYFYHRDLYDLMSAFTQSREPFSLKIERHESDTYQWMRLSANPVLNDIGTPTYFVITVEDLTDAKMRQAQKSQSYRMEMLGQLSSGVAHDFNNILSVIDGYAHLMKQDYFDDMPSKERLGHIIDAVDTGATLIRQLMDYGRQGRMKPEVINLSDMIRNLEPLLKPLLNETIQLSLNIENDVYIRCAPDQMTQVIMNLVVNSRDAMEEKGESLLINLSKEQSNDGTFYVALAIKDEGCGMNEEVRSRIFDPYYTTKSNEKGTGLGMSTVQNLAKRMNASIAIDSIEGVGTEISLHIPVTDERPCEEHSVEQDQRDKPLQGLMIMVVEDEEPVLDIFGQVLKTYGAQVILARDGNQALQLQDEHEGDIDVLLTDVVMPECDGLHLSELFQAIRPNTKVILCSGYPVATSTTSNASSNDVAFIPKPIKHSELLTAIQDGVAEKRRSDARSQSKSPSQRQSKSHALIASDKKGKKSLYTLAGNV